MTTFINPGAVEQAANGGAQPLVDLGVVHATDLLDGPVTLYTPSAGEYVQIVWGAVVAGDTGQGLEVGLASPTDANGFTNHLIGWLQFNNPGTLYSLFNEVGLFPTLGRLNGTVFDGTQPIQALAEVQTNGYAIFSTPAAWQANHVYPASVVILHGPDENYWSQSLGGTSGGTIPNFAGSPNPGDTVLDNDITWTNEGPVPTTGSIHLYALVATT